ncbi:MAG: hypothetical protein M3R04_04680 [bacterium]|nr:hypothetical protein [bacterium]
MAETGRISSYTLIWTTIFLLLGGGIWWLVHNAPSDKIDPTTLTSNRTPEKPVATIDESLGATDISIKGLDLTVKGADGKMSMQVVSWDESEMRISTKEVSYVGPNLEVSGKQMTIDMKTAEVTFDGPVVVGI